MAVERPATAASPIHTVIADDHAVVRSGIKALLEAHGSDPSRRQQAQPQRPFKVIAEVDNGIQAIAAVKQHQPDLLLLDVSMPLAGGAEVINEVRRWSGATRIAVFTGITAGGTLSNLVAAGVDGLFSKAASEQELTDNLPLLLADNRFISPSILRILQSNTQVLELTRRERQTLNMVITGKSNKEIAEALNLSEKTVSNHRSRLMAKLNVHSLAELIAYALEAGLLSAGESN